MKVSKNLYFLLGCFSDCKVKSIGAACEMADHFFCPTRINAYVAAKNYFLNTIARPNHAASNQEAQCDMTLSSVECTTDGVAIAKSLLAGPKLIAQ